MKKSKMILAFAAALAFVAGNTNAQAQERTAGGTSEVDLVVKPDASGTGAIVSGQTPDRAELVINIGGSAPVPQQPAAAVQTPTANPAPAPAAEECSTPWCTLLRIASVIAAIGAYLLEALLVFAVLAGLWYVLRRCGERRHDQTWHRRAARLRGWYEDALEASQQEGLDHAARSIWRRRARRRYARLLGHHEAAGVRPAVNTIPVPAPLTWDGADPADADEPPADA